LKLGKVKNTIEARKEIRRHRSREEKRRLWAGGKVTVKKSEQDDKEKEKKETIRA